MKPDGVERGRKITVWLRGGIALAVSPFGGYGGYSRISWYC
jgi:hypothetical protein